MATINFNEILSLFLQENWIISKDKRRVYGRVKNPETYRKGERHTKTRNEYLVA